jgi:hypothetical protein
VTTAKKTLRRAHERAADELRPVRIEVGPMKFAEGSALIEMGDTRVLAASGVIAVSTYSLLRVNPAVDRVVVRLYREVVGSYWPPERRWVEDEYRSLPFPFAEETPPPFVMEQSWNLDETVGYLSTWSACRRFAAVTGQNPVRQVMAELEEAWGPPEVRHRIRWPLHLRVGRSV